MRYLFNTTGSNSERNWCLYAIVTLDDAAIVKLRSRYDTHKHAADRDRDLDSTSYFDAHATFYPAIENDDGSTGLGENELAALQNRGWIVLADDWKPPCEADRSEIDRVVVGERDLYWTCSPKYSDDYVETFPITWADLGVGEL
jgi:hypothetical protein